jgi:hypothetical protein
VKRCHCKERENNDAFTEFYLHVRVLAMLDEITEMLQKQFLLQRYLYIKVAYTNYQCRNVDTKF